MARSGRLAISGGKGAQLSGALGPGLRRSLGHLPSVAAALAPPPDLGAGVSGHPRGPLEASAPPGVRGAVAAERGVRPRAARRDSGGAGPDGALWGSRFES